MSAERPAEHLARLRVTYPLYRIAFVTGSFGFAASRDGHPDLWALTLSRLEDKLRAARRGACEGPRDDPGPPPG